MGIQFGAVAALPDYRATVDLYRYMDEAGFRALWIPDSQSLMPEMTASMTVAALDTQTIQIFGGVTNPLTRHPAVLASAMSTVDDISGDRVSVSISTGDSAVFNVGLRPAKLSTLEAYIRTLRDLWQKGEATYDGRTVRLVWPKRAVPIYMAAEGPRSLRLAGQIADGVIIGMGLTPEIVQGALGYLEDGLRDAGRSLDDIDVWWFAKWNIAASREAAVDEIRMALAASCNHAFRFHLEGKFVPPEHRDAVQQLQREYVFHEHEKHGDKKRNAQLVDELGLKEYLAERFAIVGTLDDFIARCWELHALGVRQIRLGAAGRNHEELVRRVGTDVLPLFG